jgi:hypothetical protein
MVTQRSTKAAAGATPGAAPPVNRDTTSWTGGHAPAQPLAQSLGGGDPLSHELRSAMETRFGRDFGHVRVHSNERAGQAADAVGAQAFTVRNHIVFGTGRFSPHDPAGRSLIVHELTHVLQQQPEPTDAGLPVSLESWTASRPGDSAEREAENAAAHVSRSKPIIVQERVQNVLQGDWAGAGIGALIGGVVGGIAGALIGGVPGALIGGGLGLIAGALIGGLSGGFFPSYGDIVGDSDVQAKMSTAWASTEAAANAATRREEGFWIQLNKGTNKYEFASPFTGPLVGPAQGGSANPGTDPGDRNAGTANAVYTVALFHTHTPTAFRTVARDIGPSTADDDFHTSQDRVGIIYDYVPSPRGSGSVPAGHPIGSPARTYHSGPNRRSNP